MRRARARAALAVLAGGAAFAATPAPSPREVLAPRFFPVWQARNVAFPFVVRDAAGSYRMYYAGSGAAQVGESAWDLWMTGLATSRDGRRWRLPDDYEPVLRAGPFATGEVTAPARRARFDSMAAFGACVMREGGRHLMWYTGWNGDDAPAGPGRARPVHHRIGLALSADGVRWQKQAGAAELGAVLGLGAAEAFDAQGVAQPFVLPDGDGLRMWYEAFDGKAWRIASARSADGRAWTRDGVALEPGGPGAPDEGGARNPVVVQRRGRWELWYQGVAADGSAARVLRATSDDARRWTRAPGAVTLPLDEPLEPGEALHVDSVLVRPGGGCQVFFARERTQRRRVTWGEARSRSFHIYAAVVDP